MKALLVAITALLTVAVGMLGYGLFLQPDKWTYLVAAPKDEELLHTINQLGDQGWEIISARRATTGEGASATPAYEMILKHKGVDVRYFPSKP